MISTRSLKQKLSQVHKLWADEKYEQALADVEKLLTAWPGNPQLYILWACLVQLQEDPGHTLDEAKKALQNAVDADKNSPAGAIELGHFLDSVEDNPQEASKAYSEAIILARRLLIDGLLGQARALMQLNKREDAIKCLIESLRLTNFDNSSKKGRSPGPASEFVRISPTGSMFGLQLKASIGSELEDLLKDALASHVS